MMNTDENPQDRHLVTDRHEAPTGLSMTRVGFACLLLIYVSIRIALILSNPRVVEPEELAEGMVALELSSRGFEAIDILYAPHLLGSLVNGLLLIPIFWIFGPTGAALQVPGLCFGIIAWMASVWIAREFGGTRAGFAVGALLAFPPAILLKASLSSQGNHAEAMAFGLVVVALSAHLCRRPTAQGEHRNLGFLVGTIAGFGLMYCWTTGVWCLAATLLVLFYLRRPWRIPWIRRAAAGVIVGMIPGLLLTFASDQSGLGIPQSARGIQQQTVARMPSKASAFLIRELPRAFRIRGTDTLPVGPPLGKVLPSGWPSASKRQDPSLLNPVRRMGGFTAAVAPGSDVLGRDTAGRVWLIAALAALLVSATLGFRRRGSNESERFHDRDAWVPGVVIFAAFSILYIGGPFTIEWDYPFLDDDYIAYRYLAPAVHALVLALGITLGALATSRTPGKKVLAIGGMTVLVLLGSINASAYLLDPAHSWDPTRNSRIQGYSYGSIGTVLAHRHRAEFEEVAAAFRRGDPVDIAEIESIRKVQSWIEKLDRTRGVPLLRDFLQTVFSFRGNWRPGELEAFAEVLRNLELELEEPYSRVLGLTIDELLEDSRANPTEDFKQ